MLNYIIRKLLYGLLVLWGVVSLVFLIFNLKPGDPARMLGGQHPSPEIIEAINKDLGLDLPLFKQYALYMNDLSVISVLNNSDPASYYYDEPGKYAVCCRFQLTKTHEIVIKTPYLRKSYQTRRNVSDIIADAFPGTFILAVTAMSFALFIGLLVGIFSALFTNSFFDNTSIFLSVLGMSGPSFFMAILISWLGGYVWYAQTNLPMLPIAMFILGVLVYLIVQLKNHNKIRGFSLFSYGFKYFFIGLFAWTIAALIQFLIPSFQIPLISQTITFPGTGLEMSGSLFEYDVYKGRYLSLQNLILPAITLGIRPLAVIVMLTRSSMLDVMSQDYIKTARAKGLNTSEIVWKHAIKNAINPVITAVSGWFASMLAGAVFIEYVFGWKGLGLELYNSLIKDDLPVVMGSVLFIATIFVIMNILVDILYGIIDPRVSLK